MTHIGLQRLEGLDPEFRKQADALLDRLAVEGVRVCVVSGRRTIKEQNTLYAQGRTSKGAIVTNAKGGSSAHNFGTAVDLCPVDQTGHLDWNDRKGFERIGALAEELGLVWGGHFKSIVDKPHVEAPGWRIMQARWKAGNLEVA